MDQKYHQLIQIERLLLRHMNLTMAMLQWTIFLLCIIFTCAQPQIKCSRLRPLKNITTEQLNGEWVTLNELLFVNGIPKSAGTGESLRPNACIRHEVRVINATTVTWVPVFSFYRGHESRGGELFVTKRPNGKWTTKTEDGRVGGRMLVLAADKDTYIVRASCIHTGEPRKLVLKSVSVESRREEDGPKRGALQAEEQVEVKEKITKLLGFTYKPVHFGFYC